MASVAVGDDVLAAQINQLLLKPVVKLVAQATQSIAHNTAVALQFAAGSEERDTHNFHDVAVNNTRITVDRDGDYTARGVVPMGALANYTLINAWIRLNGVTNKAPADRRGLVTTAAPQVQTAFASSLVTLNAGEYAELMVQFSSGAAAAQATNQSGQFSASFELIFERPLI